MMSNGVYTHSWVVDDPKANVLIIHGLGEHIHRYEELASEFNRKGFSIYGFDHIGHGRSSGRKGHIDSYVEIYDYIAAVTEDIPDSVPLFAYGHSMGGNILLNYLIDRSCRYKGAILTGSYITDGKALSPILVMIGRLMSKIYPKLLLDNGLDLSSLSTDAMVIETYKNDHHVHSKISAGHAARMIDKAKFLQDFKGSLSCPVLLMHGENDQITGPDGTQMIYNNIQSDKDLKIWKDELHEIHNGVKKELVWDHTISWIETQLSIV